MRLDVRGSVHHSTVHKEIQQDATVYQNLLFHIYMKLNMFRATPPVIRSLKLHYQLLVLHTWKVVGCVVAGRCQALMMTGVSPETW